MENPFEKILDSLKELHADISVLKAAAGVGNEPPLSGYGEYLTRIEVADLFKVTPKTVRNWADDGKLTPFQTGRRVLYSREEVLRLLRASQR